MFKRLFPFKNLSPNNSFFLSISKIISGNLIGQLVVFVSYPLISRLYSPETFGIYAVYISLLGILTCIATLRYEAAIPLPKRAIDALQLTGLCCLIVIIIAVIISIILAIFPQTIANFTKQPELSHYLWLVPIGLLGAGIYDSLSYWTIRSRDFGLIAYTKLMQGIAMAVIQIALGFLLHSPAGLILGYIARHALGSTNFLKRIFKRYRKPQRYLSCQRMTTLAKQYKRFPLLATPSNLLNALALYLPVILLSACYGAKVAGLFGLGIQIVQAPLSIMRQAVTQVYIGEGAKLLHTNMTALKQLYKDTLIRLLLLGILPMLILLFLAPIIFAIVFGHRWEEAGKFIQIQSVMLWVEFAIVSASQNFSLLQRQEVSLYWNIGFVILMLLAFMPALFFSVTPATTILLYSLAKLIAYIIMLLLNLYILKQRQEATN